MIFLKSAARKGIVHALRSGLRMTGETGRRLIAEAQAQTSESLLEVIEHVDGMRFYCLGETALWRVRTLFTKEPETIEWIDGFEFGDTFWDIGANIGIYSIYAAKRGARVLAFEPSAANYLLLNRNIELNRVPIHAYCIAIGKEGFDVLNMQSTGFGSALSAFGEAIDYNGAKFKPVFEQGSLGFSLNELGTKLPFPDHIKIDVDGLEGKIIAGAANMLAVARLRSVLIELEAERAEPVVSIMRDAGFKLRWARHAGMFDSGPYANIFNYLFVRTAERTWHIDDHLYGG